MMERAMISCHNYSLSRLWPCECNNTSSLVERVRAHHGPIRSFCSAAVLPALVHHNIIGSNTSSPNGPRRVYCQIHNRLNWANTSLSAAYAHGHHGPIQANWQNTHAAIIWARVRHMFSSCRHLHQQTLEILVETVETVDIVDIIVI